MQEKIYDLQPLNALVDGNDKFRQYLIELFIQTTPPILEDLKNSLLINDLEGVYAHTHKVKPTLDSLGMFSLRPIVEGIMKQVKTKNKDNTLENLVETLCHKVTLAIEQLQLNEL